MRKLMIATIGFGLCLVATGAVAEIPKGDTYNIANRLSDNDYGKDYAFHYGAGALIGGLVVAYIPKKWDWHPVAKIGAGIIVAMAVKGVFEALDDAPRLSDVLDYGIGAAGGGTATWGVTILKIKFFTGGSLE